MDYEEKNLSFEYYINAESNIYKHLFLLDIKVKNLEFYLYLLSVIYIVIIFVLYLIIYKVSSHT
jgi:hypothetical protein